MSYWIIYLDLFMCDAVIDVTALFWAASFTVALNIIAP